MYIVYTVCECARLAIVRDRAKSTVDIKITAKDDCIRCGGKGTIGVGLVADLPMKVADHE